MLGFVYDFFSRATDIIRILLVTKQTTKRTNKRKLLFPLSHVHILHLPPSSHISSLAVPPTFFFLFDANNRETGNSVQSVNHEKAILLYLL